MLRSKVCSWFVRGREVRPRRAREAFWRWEHAFARCTRDIVIVFEAELSGKGREKVCVCVWPEGRNGR